MSEHLHPPVNTTILETPEERESRLWGGGGKGIASVHAPKVEATHTPHHAPEDLPSSLDAKGHQAAIDTQAAIEAKARDILRASTSDGEGSLASLRRGGRKERKEFETRRSEIQAAFDSLPKDRQASLQEEIAAAKAAKAQEAKEAREHLAAARAAVDASTSSASPAKPVEKLRDPIFADRPNVRAEQHAAAAAEAAKASAKPASKERTEDVKTGLPLTTEAAPAAQPAEAAQPQGELWDQEKIDAAAKKVVAALNLAASKPNDPESKVSAEAAHNMLNDLSAVVRERVEERIGEMSAERVAGFSANETSGEAGSQPAEAQLSLDEVPEATAENYEGLLLEYAKINASSEPSKPIDSERLKAINRSLGVFFEDSIEGDGEKVEAYYRAADLAKKKANLDLMTEDTIGSLRLGELPSGALEGYATILADGNADQAINKATFNALKAREAEITAIRSVPTTTMDNFEHHLIQHYELQGSTDPVNNATVSALSKSMSIFNEGLVRKGETVKLAEIDHLRQMVPVKFRLNQSTPDGMKAQPLDRIPAQDLETMLSILDAGNKGETVDPDIFKVLQDRRGEIEDQVLANNTPPDPATPPTPNVAPEYEMDEIEKVFDYWKSQSADQIRAVKIGELKDSKLEGIAYATIAGREDPSLFSPEQHKALVELSQKIQIQHQRETASIEAAAESSILVRTIEGEMKKARFKRGRKQYATLLKEAEDIRDKHLAGLRPEAAERARDRIAELAEPLEYTAYTWDQAAALGDITVEGNTLASTAAKLPIVGRFVKAGSKGERTMSMRDALLDGTIRSKQIPEDVLIYDANGNPLSKPRSKKEVKEYKKNFVEKDDLGELPVANGSSAPQKKGFLEKRKENRREAKATATIHQLEDRLKNPVSDKTREVIQGIIGGLQDRHSKDEDPRTTDQLIANGSNFAKIASEESKLRSWVNLGTTSRTLSATKKAQLKGLLVNEDGTPLDPNTQWPLIRTNLKKAKKIAGKKS